MVDQIRRSAATRRCCTTCWPRPAQDEARTAELEAEERGLEKDLTAWQGEVTQLSAQFRPGEDNGALVARLADLQERVGMVEGRVQQVRDEIQAVTGRLLDEEEAARALAAFDPVWGTLTPREQARVVGLLVERVDYDGAQGKVSITFHPTGIKTLADELAGSSTNNHGRNGHDHYGMTGESAGLTVHGCGPLRAAAGKGGRKELRAGPAPQGPEVGRVPRVSRG